MKRDPHHFEIHIVELLPFLFLGLMYVISLTAPILVEHWNPDLVAQESERELAIASPLKGKAESDKHNIVLTGKQRAELIEGKQIAVRSVIPIPKDKASSTSSSALTPPPITADISTSPLALLQLKVKLGMQVIVSILFGGVSLIIIVRKKSNPTEKHWACGMVGLIVGFWLKL
ncbi:hypothetical protein [Alloacidobacterium sp.]|uniref:hypothetical protein n=1 Tax=Alloacidobacterium sp. TaxID=2951999 RepID=UPI002D5DC1D6|nr:hypothetical protein [Alloacidobacterium sp.]HYK34426.1 hypothetical protein [Alloacidobacterium sp.]